MSCTTRRGRGAVLPPRVLYTECCLWVGVGCLFFQFFSCRTVLHASPRIIANSPNSPSAFPPPLPHRATTQLSTRMQAEALDSIRQAHNQIAICLLVALPLVIYAHAQRAGLKKKDKAN